MFSYIKNKLTSLKQYIQKGLSDFIQDPMVETAQAMASKVKPQLTAAAIETIDALKPKVEQTARAAIAAAINESTSRLKSVFDYSTATKAASPLTTEINYTNTNVITNLFKAFYTFVSDMLRNFAVRILHTFLGLSMITSRQEPGVEASGVSSTLADDLAGSRSSLTLAPVTSLRDIGQRQNHSNIDYTSPYEPSERNVHARP